MRRSLILAVLLITGCTGTAPTVPVPTSSFSPADTKTLGMICTWRASVTTISAGLKPLMAQFPVISDHAAFKASLNTLRGASAALTVDPASHDPWQIALERRHPRDELMELVKVLGIDSDPLWNLYTTLDAWATEDDLDPTSDRAALLQQEIGSLQPLLSDELGTRLCS